jgi:tetratricopeptide (TPR) repeat protein
VPFCQPQRVPPLHLGWWGGGLLLCVTLCATEPPPLAPLAEQAQAAYAAKNWPAAETAFRQLAEQSPASGAACYHLGKLAVLREDYVLAAQWLEKAATLAPQESDYHLWLGNCYAWAASTAPLRDKPALGRQCLAAYRRAIALDPDNVAARMGLLHFYRHVPRLLGGGLDRAYAEAEEIRCRDTDLGALARAILQRHEQKYPLAYAALTELRRRQPDDYTVHYELGRLAVQAGRWLDEGERSLRHCLAQTQGENDASHDLVWWNLGQLAEHRREPAAARQAYQACLRLNPRHQAATAALARLR